MFRDVTDRQTYIQTDITMVQFGRLVKFPLPTGIPDEFPPRGVKELPLHRRLHTTDQAGRHLRAALEDLSHQAPGQASYLMVGVSKTSFLVVTE